MKILEKQIEIVNESVIEFPIIPNGSGWKSTESQKLSVIESGDQRVMLSSLINAIDGAKRVICLQSFLIQDGELIDALINAVEKRGVRVFVLSSVEARLKATIEEEPDFIKAEYVKLLDGKFKNRFIHRASANFHGKYILIDPSTKPKGFVFTNNVTENGFVKNPELAIELSRLQCEELFKVFVYHFWEQSSDEQNATSEFTSVKAAQKFSLPKLQHILLTSPNTKFNTLSKTLLDAVRKAKSTISLSTYQLDNSTELMRAVLDKAKDGIPVTVFCRPIERQFNEQLKPLLQAGVTVYFHPYAHAKSILVDDKTGFVFTANLIANGLEKGLEVGLQLNENQTRDLAKIHQEWQKSFPAKAIKEALVSELEKVQVFEGVRLIGKGFTEETKSAGKKIETVEQLFSFFNQNFEIKDRFVKKSKIKLIAEIQSVSGKPKIISQEKGFDVVEIGNRKGKQSKAVVLKEDFDIEDLPSLEDWRNFKIYTIQ